MDKLFGNYEVKLLVQMVKSFGKSINRMYSMGVCAILGMSYLDALSEDLESDSFINSTLQRFTCRLFYRFGSLVAPLSIGLITGRHYLLEQTLLQVLKMAEQMALRKETSEWPITPSKFAGLGAAMAAGVLGVLGYYIY